MNNKPLLAFDCAGAGASISLRADGVTPTRILPQGKQASHLVSEINALMESTQITYDQLGAIITTIGPGSFTGIRIGLAALHGFALAANTPIKTITTLEAIAWQVALLPAAPARFTVAIRAGKGELYAQEFTADAGKPRAAGEIFLVPETHSQWPSACFSDQLSPDSKFHVAGVSTERLCDIADQLPNATLSEALPLYIRPPDAIIPKPLAWLC